MLEELTWTEVQQALKAGASIVIIPIGGTEQSGPHMALGKHNVRVKTLAGRIASRLGNVSADGKYLWLSGRYDDVVYWIDTQSGAVDKIKVGHEPHGLTVWPQSGRYSLGHTGNLR